MKMPVNFGYRMPAEWEPQQGTWLSWPSNEETFNGYLEDTKNIYLKIITLLSKTQEVYILVDDDDTKAEVWSRLVNLPSLSINRVKIFVIKTVDVWIRDYGPTFVTKTRGENRLAMIHWDFNAWGKKYQDLKDDSIIPDKINNILSIPRFKPGITLEGGAIDVSSNGCLLTTESCILNENRNPSLSKNEMEQILKDCLGVKKILWLKRGISGDDTDGHIDEVARFVRPGTIVCSIEKNDNDINYAILKENLEILKKSTGIHGETFTVVEIPMPDPVEIDDIRLPASYMNFYITNGTVLVPVFGQKEKDRIAINILTKLFPNRNIVGINSIPLLFGYGAIHCITQQQPKKF